MTSAAAIPVFDNYSASAATQASASMSQIGAMSGDQVDKVAKDFESMFIGEMLEPMFGDSIGTDAFGDEASSDVYKGLMMEEYGKTISKAGGVGVADYVKRELLKLQEIMRHVDPVSRVSGCTGSGKNNKCDPAQLLRNSQDL